MNINFSSVCQASLKILKSLRQKISEYPSITLVILATLLAGTIYSWFRIKFLKSQIPTMTSVEVVTKDSETKTSLKFTDTPFTPEPSFSQEQAPSQVIFWKTDTVLISSSDTVFQAYTDSFWRSTPDSVVQFLVDRKTLTLTTHNSSSDRYITSEYKLKLDQYKYNWQPHTGLTRERDRYLAIQPYLSGSYQPIHSVMNLGTGISLKTRKLDYNLGIHLNRDTRVNPKIYPDLEVSVVYYPIRWQKR